MANPGGDPERSPPGASVQGHNSVSGASGGLPPWALRPHAHRGNRIGRMARDQIGEITRQPQIGGQAQAFGTDDLSGPVCPGIQPGVILDQNMEIEPPVDAAAPLCHSGSGNQHPALFNAMIGRQAHAFDHCGTVKVTQRAPAIDSQNRLNPA